MWRIHHSVYKKNPNTASIHISKGEKSGSQHNEEIFTITK